MLRRSLRVAGIPLEPVDALPEKRRYTKKAKTTHIESTHIESTHIEEPQIIKECKDLAAQTMPMGGTMDEEVKDIARSKLRIPHLLNQEDKRILRDLVNGI